MKAHQTAALSRFMTDSEVTQYSEVARHLQLDVSTLYKLVREGQIPVLVVGPNYRFNRDTIEKLVTDQPATGHSAFVNPSKIQSVAAILNSDPPSVRIKLLCSLCGELDFLVVNLDDPGVLSLLRRHDFYFVCGRHRHWAAN